MSQPPSLSLRKGQITDVSKVRRLSSLRTNLVLASILSLFGACTSASESDRDGGSQEPTSDGGTANDPETDAGEVYFCGGSDGREGIPCSACLYFKLSLDADLDEVDLRHSSPCATDNDCVYVPFPDVSCGNLSISNTGRSVLDGKSEIVRSEFIDIHNSFCSEVPSIESECVYNLEGGLVPPRCYGGVCVEW